MNIARFEPWTIVDLLHRDLDRLVGGRGVAGDDQSPVADWVPAVDIVEEADRFVLRADVPGAVSYTHLTLPTIVRECRSRWSPYH